MTVVDELRDALARHDEWPTADTGALVIDAARQLIRGVDMRTALIAQMRADVSPSEQAIAELLGES